jgi:hypothetical protein
MKQRSDIEKRVEETLNSLDGIQRATPQPWLFTRVKARLMQEEKTAWGTMSSFLARPVITIAGLFIILTLNGILLFNQVNKKSSSALLGGQNEQVMDSESLIASSSSFDYENLVQP